MKKYSIVIILLNLLVLLMYFNYGVVQKERLLKNGRLVLLELAPVDPRSLMQGDYMALRYKIANESDTATPQGHGYCVIATDEKHVARAVRFQKKQTPLNAGELVLKYTAHDSWDVRFGAASFFFQEGQADKYAVAKYGALKIDDSGNSLLVGLYNKDLKKIE